MRKLIAALLCAASFLAAQSIDEAAVVAAARAELTQTGTPGAVIGIVINNRLAHTLTVGVSSTETNAPVDPRMLFRLGSTTKMMTATDSWPELTEDELADAIADSLIDMGQRKGMGDFIVRTLICNLQDRITTH